MPIDYLRSIIRTDVNSEFFYTGDYAWQRNGIPVEELQNRIPVGEPSAADGEFQADSFLAARSWSYRVMVIGSDYQDLQNKLTAFWLAHPAGGLCKLRRQIISTTGAVSTTLYDAFLECRINGRSKGAERGFLYNEPEITIRSGKPWYQDTALQTAVPLSHTGGTTGVTPGGTEKCEPVFTLVCTTGGQVTILESFYSNSITFTVVPGTYVVDMSQPTNPVFLAGTPTLGAIVAGGPFKIAPLASNLTVSLAAGAVLSSASVQWRRAWAFT